MSGGYRLVIAAALGLAALVILGTGAYFGALYGTHHSQEAAIAANRDASAKQAYPSQIDRNRAGLPDVAERMTSGPDPKSADERENRDLAAQESTSVWTFWMLVVSSLGVLMTMIGTAFLLWQITLTRKAVEDTGKATEAMVESNKISLLALKAEHKPHICITPLGPYTEMASYPKRSAAAQGVMQDATILCPVRIENRGAEPVTIFKVQLRVDGSAFGGEPMETFSRLDPGDGVTFAGGGLPLARGEVEPHPIGWVMANTLKAWDNLHRNRPAVIGLVTYDDSIGIRREMHFAYRPDFPWDCTAFSLWGGTKYNYEKEIA